MSSDNELRTILEDDSVQRQRVEVYVVNEEGLLLSTYKYGKYPELPGGGIDKGESIIQAGYRECQEESGYAIRDTVVKRIPFTTLYEDKEKDDHWFVDLGYSSELDHAILARQAIFRPDSRYVNTDDGNVFSFNPIKDIIRETEQYLESGEGTSLRKHHARSRLQFLDWILKESGIFPITKVRVLDRTKAQLW